jgi:S-adenosylmethionine synthetase
MARHVARKHRGGQVAAGQVKIAYAISVARPMSIMVETFSLEGVEHHAREMVRRRFDFTPMGSSPLLDRAGRFIRRRQPTAASCRSEPEFTGENTNGRRICADDVGI